MIQNGSEDRNMDPFLAAALQKLRDEPPPAVDWDRLRSSINDSARLPLARRRTRAAVLNPRRLVPLAAAAALAFAFWASPPLLERVLGPATPMEQATLILDDEEILVRALGDDISDDEFHLLVTGRAHPEALLSFAVRAR
jgi:hypothetical protein